MQIKQNNIYFKRKMHEWNFLNFNIPITHPNWLQLIILSNSIQQSYDHMHRLHIAISFYSNQKLLEVIPLHVWLAICYGTNYNFRQNIEKCIRIISCTLKIICKWLSLSETLWRQQYCVQVHCNNNKLDWAFESTFNTWVKAIVPVARRHKYVNMNIVDNSHLFHGKCMSIRRPCDHSHFHFCPFENFINRGCRQLWKCFQHENCYSIESTSHSSSILCFEPFFLWKFIVLIWQSDSLSSHDHSMLNIKIHTFYL